MFLSAMQQMLFGRTYIVIEATFIYWMPIYQVLWFCDVERVWFGIIVDILRKFDLTFCRCSEPENGKAAYTEGCQKNGDQELIAEHSKSWPGLISRLEILFKYFTEAGPEVSKRVKNRDYVRVLHISLPFPFCLPVPDCYHFPSVAATRYYPILFNPWLLPSR